MIEIAGYEILEQVYSSEKTLIYRAKRLSDNINVILKLPQQEYSSFKELVKFRHQYLIQKRFNSSYVIKSYSLENYRDRFVIVLEDCNVISLHKYIKKQKIDLQDFLQIAIETTYILELLYEKRIIHKDIKPANLLINPKTKSIKIIDFSISSSLLKEPQKVQSTQILEGTLAYISPEQTGKMNRGIDYRADFYSLGVTFYELLTGQLPFDSDNPVELIYCHLAKKPPSLQDFLIAYSPSKTEKIPSIISNIVHKLMEKTPEKRYQSAYGLRHDLETCLEQLQSNNHISPFPLAQKDRSDRFLIPEKLYGRETEIKTLLDAFERVCDNNENQGCVEMMLVTGFSGIGKTAVVNEVQKPVVRQKSYFIKGKFDQYKKNIPLNALVESFQSLIRQILTETDQQIDYWRKSLQKALGDNGQVIVDVIPELELIIGSQLPLAELSPTESQNRFRHFFNQFIQVFTRPEHPLVLFLDDLQWVDSASLNLIKLLMKTKECSLLLIGAYRDNEVNATHPLIITLNEIRQEKAVVNEIHLQPLDSLALNQLIADTLKCSLKKALPLTQLVDRKTKSNPFFATQFLKSLHAQKLIYFDFDGGGWQCNLTEIRQLSVDEDVVSFLANQLQKLPESTQDFLKLAACIGNNFDLENLAIVAQKDITETASSLWFALKEGFIIPLNEIYKFYQTDELSNSQSSSYPNFFLSLINNKENCFYRFLHDRVQQASYSLINQNQRQETHLKIGQILLDNLSEKQIKEHVFDIVNQLNIGRDLITNEIEKIRLAQLNLTAGEKALDSNALIAALEYFVIGIHLLNQKSWQTNYQLMLVLSEKAAESAYLNGNFDLMNEFINNIEENADTLLDKQNIYQVQIQAYIAQNKLGKAVDTAFTFLKPLGVEFPESITPQDIEEALTNTAEKLKGKNFNDLIDSPPMTDKLKLAAMETLGSVASAAYIGFPQLYPLVILKQVDLSIEYGNAPSTTYAYATYGLIMCGVAGDIDAGYDAGKFALDLLQKFEVTRLKAKVFNLVYPFVRPWKKHLRESIKPLLEGYQSGLETGDLEFAAYCAYNHCAINYFVGNQLVDVGEKMQVYGEAIAEIKQTTALNFHNIYRQSIVNLLGKTSTEIPWLLTGEAYNEEEMLSIHEEASDKFAIATLYFNKLILSYLFEEKEEAIRLAYLTEENLSGMGGYPTYPVFYLYDSLIQLWVINEQEDSQQIKLLNRVNLNQEKLENWANHSPQNYLHKFYLVEAEKHRFLKDKIQAVEYYDKAIEEAKKNKFVQEEALSYELAAKFYLEWQRDLIAQTYMIKAYYAYAYWGAKIKIESLEKKYQKLLAPILIKKTNTKPADSLQSFTTNTIREKTINSNNSDSVSSNSDILDLQTIIKASQTISSEIELHKLLSTLMQVIMENVGASHSALILNQNQKLQLVAQCSHEDGCNLQPIDINQVKNVPLNVINYVWRVQKILVVNDVEADRDYSGDSYFEEKSPQSFLCMPILHKSKPLGVIYLENNVIKHLFNSDRLTILKLLVSQAAISIENAQLYEKLEHNTFYDSLTSLPNRFYFLNLLEHSIQLSLQDKSYNYAVLYLDLDRFKIVNESLGHTIGDELLKLFAVRLKNTINESNTIARFGGDEFAILLENIDDFYEAVKVAQKIQQEFQKPFIVNQHEILSPASIGITSSTIKYEKPANVLRDADIAMYRAKSQGQGNYQIFDPKMQANVSERLNLENSLRRGIINQEFSLYYQPIICVENEKLAGFEALIRWQHPQKGFVSPAEFIPIAEETGSIIPIGIWVFEEACQQLSFWQQHIPKNQQLTLNVNLSIKQLSQKNLIEQINNIITKTGLPPHFLKLEITESAIMNDYKNARKILQKIKKQNIQLCIDDFGTGYSSLSYLHRFPLDTLKIDRSFITNIVDHPKKLEIVEGIIRLAHSLEMNVVAEGIENQQQYNLLKQLGCEFVQGFFFSKPLNKQEATRLIEQSLYEI